MKIKRVIAGLSAVSIAAMTTAALSASAATPVKGSPTAGTKLARENAKSVIARSINNDITDGTPSLEKEGGIAVDPVESNIPLMILVVEFPNVKYDTTADWGEKVFKNDYSVSSYYNDMSGGKFTFTPVEETSAYDGDLNLNEADKENDGVVHVTISQDHGNWANLSDDEEFVSTWLPALKEALETAGDYVDYAKYDTNGNGMIETEELSLGIVVAGYEGSYTGDNSGNDDFWCHAWSYSDSNDDPSAVDYPEVNGVKLNKYIAVGEFFDEDFIACTNPLTHELGHYIGLADYYDTQYLENEEWNGYNPGDFSPMASGEWGVDADFSTYLPVALDEVSKMILGWANTETVTTDGTYELIAEDYDVPGSEHKGLVIPTQNAGEYYVLEIRNGSKWDAGIKHYSPEPTRDGGIVLYHVDENVWDEPSDVYSGYYTNGEGNTINVPSHRPGLTVTYLELNEEGIPVPIGDIGYDATAPLPSGANEGMTIPAPIAMFSKSAWEYYTAGTDMGNEMNLAIYGTGDSKDVRSARTLSGIKIEFLDDVSSTMHVKVSFTDPEEPVDSSEPDSSSVADSSVPDSSSVAPVDTTSSKITDTAVANTGAGAGLGAVAAVAAGALITVVSRKRKNNEEE